MSPPRYTVYASLTPITGRSSSAPAPFPGRVRGLAHPGHWAGPFGKWFEQFGAVKASPMAAFRLLKGGEKVLLFPGGAK